MPDDRWLAGDAYERFMGRWSRPLAHAFLDWLQPPRSARWLDVGCGTGALTTAICARCDPRSVVACDPSEAFVAHARQVSADPRARFVVAGAGSLPTVDGGFDAVVSGLVLNFVPDPAAALMEIRERLAPGGIAAVYVWDYAGQMAFLRAFWDEAAGFADVRTGPIEIATTFDDFDDYWTPFLRGTGPAPGYAASRTDDQRAQLRERLRLRLAPDGGPIALRARAWAVRGRR